jgi:hypothetical protein
MATNKALGGKDTMKRRRWEKCYIEQVWGKKVYKSKSHWLQKSYNARVVYSWKVSSILSWRE